MINIQRFIGHTDSGQYKGTPMFLVRADELNKMEDLIHQIAEDAMWHDGVQNQEALDDIRDLLRSEGYTKEWAHNRP